MAVVFCILLYSAQDPQCFCNLWLYSSSAFCKILGCYHFKYSSASFSPLVQETQLPMWHVYVQTCSIFSAEPESPTSFCCTSIPLFSFDLTSSSLNFQFLQSCLIYQNHPLNSDIQLFISTLEFPLY